MSSPPWADRAFARQRSHERWQVSSHIFTSDHGPHAISGNAKVAGMSTDLNLVGLKYNTAAAVFFVWFSLLAFLKHDRCSFRSYTVSRKSRRQSNHHILILRNNFRARRNIILKLFRPSRWCMTIILLTWLSPSDQTCQCSTYNHGCMGSGHDAYVPGEYLSRPSRVRFRRILRPTSLMCIYIPCSARVFLGLTEAGLFPGVTYYISLWYPRADRAMRIAIFFSAATVAGAFGGILA